jgi:hypothetical protein
MERGEGRVCLGPRIHAGFQSVPDLFYLPVTFLRPPATRSNAPYAGSGVPVVDLVIPPRTATRYCVGSLVSGGNS